MASTESPTPRDPSPAASKRASEAAGSGQLALGAADMPEIKRYVRQQVVTVPASSESPAKGVRVPTLQLKVVHEGQSMTLSDALKHRPSGVRLCEKNQRPPAATTDSSSWPRPNCPLADALPASKGSRGSPPASAMPGSDPPAAAADRATRAQWASRFPQASLSTDRAVVNHAQP